MVRPRGRLLGHDTVLFVRPAGLMYLRHWTICGPAPGLSQLGKRAAQWYAPFHQSHFYFLIKSTSLSLSQSKLSCSHILFICEIDEYQNSRDINPNPISPMLAQNRSFPSYRTLLWSTSLQPFVIVALWRSKYQLTKYPNCICRKLWCVPVTFLLWKKISFTLLNDRMIFGDNSH